MKWWKEWEKFLDYAAPNNNKQYVPITCLIILLLPLAVCAALTCWFYLFMVIKIIFFGGEIVSRHINGSSIFT